MSAQTIAYYFPVYNDDAWEVGGVLATTGEIFGIAPDGGEFTVSTRARACCTVCGLPDLEINGPSHEPCEEIMLSEGAEAAHDDDEPCDLCNASSGQPCASNCPGVLSSVENGGVR